MMSARLVVLAAIAAAGPASAQKVLYERGPVASIPGGHTSGAGFFQAVPAGAAAGVTLDHGIQMRLAQPFEATADWVVDRVTVWAYQNGATLQTTFTGLHLEVWDGSPRVAGSKRVAGNLSTNVLTETEFSDVYASFAGGDWRTDRPVMALIAEGLSWRLEPGTYWLIWAASGELRGGPYATYLATAEAPIEGEALQARFGVWRPAEARSGVQLAFPMLLEGRLACFADCDGSGGLDFFDFLCFQNQFAAGDPVADCDGSGGLDFFDFLCFQNEFALGCQ